ncbi:unnamed protein product [Effrenium voratum]|nr:unnamed protein product [Effrenium voratum]
MCSLSAACPGCGKRPMKCLWCVLLQAAALNFDRDVQVFTANKCADIVDKANSSGHVTEESSISVCRKHSQSKETCGLLGEMLALAQMRADFNKSSFCEMMSSAHSCSSAMEDFLSSDAVADLAFGHCQRLKQKSPDYCQRFKGVLTAVKAETVDTLRECYMLELQMQPSTAAPTSEAPDAEAPTLGSPEALQVSQEAAKGGGVVAPPPRQVIAAIHTRNVSQVNGTRGKKEYTGFLSRFVS